MMIPGNSWVAKWNGLTSNVPGVYAIDLVGYGDDEGDYIGGANDGDYGEEDDNNFIAKDDELE
jgi:hypothetical protein